jgi:hypothetical protein
MLYGEMFEASSGAQNIPIFKKGSGELRETLMGLLD